ncbi:hypothetical protein V1504DRAFT_471883 [Lipomyces starkeyi]
MNFYDWAEAPENFTPDLLTLGLSGVEFEENSMLWNDHYTWIASTCQIFEGEKHYLRTESQTFNNPLTIPTSDGLFSKPDGFKSIITQTPSEGSTADEDNVTSSKAMKGQRYAIIDGKDTTLNRTQHRRTQNRNSQRAYRQKRADELRAFKTRAIAAEETSMQVNTNLRELELLVTSLKNKVQQLEADNLALRTSTYSMPWRKSSFRS